MSNLTFKNLKLFDIINKESDTFIRTPEPTELCVRFNDDISVLVIYCIS